jgi:hypothetical protein
LADEESVTGVCATETWGYRLSFGVAQVKASDARVRDVSGRYTITARAQQLSAAQTFSLILGS